LQTKALIEQCRAAQAAGADFPTLWVTPHIDGLM
jgi:hypothetical protein